MVNLVITDNFTSWKTEADTASISIETFLSRSKLYLTWRFSNIDKLKKYHKFQLTDDKCRSIKKK